MAKKKQKQEIDLSGTTVQITELQRKFLFIVIEQRVSAQTGLDYFARALKKAKADLFETLFDFRPDLKNYHFKYNSYTGEVEVLAKKNQTRRIISKLLSIPESKMPIPLQTSGRMLRR